MKTTTLAGTVAGCFVVTWFFPGSSQVFYTALGVSLVLVFVVRWRGRTRHYDDD
jgi:hypothetical protein